MIVLPLENIRIGQVERLLKHDAAVSPGQPIIASGKGNFTEAVIAVQDFEKHVEFIAVLYPERIGDENRVAVCHVVGGKNRIKGTSRSRCCENIDRPDSTGYPEAMRPASLFETAPKISWLSARSVPS